jgi:hypothetical protein
MTGVPGVELVSGCGAVAASCECVDSADHTGRHHCDCGGSWYYDADGTFCVDTLPPLPELPALFASVLDSIAEFLNPDEAPAGDASDGGSNGDDLMRGRWPKRAGNDTVELAEEVDPRGRE